jgi:glycosyltransferase involved in cell wall biosynthesis
MARRILSTHYFPKQSAWTARVEMLDRRELSRPELFRRIVAGRRNYEAVVVNGSIGARELYVDLAAAALISHGARSPAVVVTDATWKLGRSALDRVACRAAIRALDSPRVYYCVLSTQEEESFPRMWDVDPRRVRFVPYRYTLEDEELDAPTAEESGVFAGGDSLRDYRLLLEAAASLNAEITVASGALSPADHSNLPTNVRALGTVPHHEFVDLMRHARVVVVPLKPRPDRSAGQQTYLNAMAMGKAVVVTDAPGVRDHVADRETGLVVPYGDPAALTEALEWVLDPANAAEVGTMRTRARETAHSQFGTDSYVGRLLEVVDEAVSH